MLGHSHCIRFKILCLFKIDYDAAATNEKARIFLQGLREYLEALPRSEGLSGDSMDINYMGKMLSIHNVTTAQTDIIG